MKRTRIKILFVSMMLVLLLALVPTISFANGTEEQMTVTASSTWGNPGEVAEITVSLDNNPGIASMKLTIGYDSYLTLTEVKFDTAFGAYVTAPTPYANPQTLNFINPMSETTANGNFATLTFAISEDTPDNYEAEVIVTYETEDTVDKELNKVAINTVNGRVRIYHGLAGDVDGNRSVNNKDAILLFQYVSGWGKDEAWCEANSIDLDALNVNGDASINNIDAITLFRYVAGWDVEIYRGSVCNHSLTYYEANEPTCTEDGNVEYWHCDKCGKYYSGADAKNEISISDTIIYAPGHSLIKYDERPATCTENGNYAYWQCDECDKCFIDMDAVTEIPYYDLMLEPVGHFYSYEWSYDDTYHWYDAVCGCENEISDKGTHNWDDGEEIKAATIYETGIIKYTCIICAYSKHVDTPILLSHTVKFCDDDGTVFIEQIVEHGKSATMLEIPNKDGYRFLRWDKSYDNITEDTIVKAVWQPIVEISFVDYDGFQIYSEYVDVGSDFTNIPTPPTRVDYRFIGWDITNYENITEDLTVTAQYVRTYRVAFIDYDGTVIKNENVDNGGSATAPNSPVREGYTFAGWDTSFDKVTSNLAIYAVYTINKYMVTFVDPVGTIVSKQEVKYGFSAVEPEVNDKYFHFAKTDENYIYGKGYSFTEWSDSYKQITSDKTIVAIYGEEITETIIVVESKEKNVLDDDSQTVTISVYVANGNNLCGISLDMLIDPMLLNAGAPEISVSGQKLGDGSEYYDSRLNSDGRYEFRWTKSSGITNDTIVTFTFKLNKFNQPQKYIIEILDSSYIITDSLQKITPVLISGSIAVNQ